MHSAAKITGLPVPSRESRQEARVAYRVLQRRGDPRDWPGNSAPPRSFAPFRRSLERSRARIDAEIESQSETHAGPEWDDADAQAGAM